MHYFLFIVVFFNCLLTVIEFVDYTHSCVKQLMPGSNNIPYALNKPATFIYDLFVPVGIKRSNVIYLGLFQCSYFQRSSLYIFFLFCQLNTKIKKSYPLPVLER